MRNIHTDKPEHEDDIYTGDLKDLQKLKDQEPYLTTLWENNKEAFFKESTKLFISLANTGKITRQTAAYKIAGWRSNKDLIAIPEIELIVMLAGELELPYRQATKKGDKASYDKQWLKLQNMIHCLPVDVSLLCSNCNNWYLFSAEEQRIYASLDLVYLPTRCIPCRELHKKQVAHIGIACDVCGYNNI